MAGVGAFNCYNYDLSFWFTITVSVLWYCFI